MEREPSIGHGQAISREVLRTMLLLTFWRGWDWVVKRTLPLGVARFVLYEWIYGSLRVFVLYFQVYGTSCAFVFVLVLGRYITPFLSMPMLSLSLLFSLFLFGLKAGVV